MIGALLLLGLVVFGLACLIGVAKPKRLGSVIIGLILVPVVLSIVWTEATRSVSESPLLVQVAALLALPLAIVIAMRLAFPQSGMIRGISERLRDLTIYFLAFPIRLVWRVGAYVIDREGRGIDLTGHHPVIGDRPPSGDRDRSDRRHER